MSAGLPLQNQPYCARILCNRNKQRNAQTRKRERCFPNLAKTYLIIQVYNSFNTNKKVHSA
ncbi:hypothetical protein EOV40_008225 [Acetobacter oryzoeni]|uniref:Uncharacterized protein n=1 Tax=Acetobacter oryzoeni TaxID=2500548 RepID=A0A5B9GK89_9PROT|nr:hypothetical protein EOV40_008225 [Acetobacter oryzoeni]